MERGTSGRSFRWPKSRSIVQRVGQGYDGDEEGEASEREVRKKCLPDKKEKKDRIRFFQADGCCFNTGEPP